MDCEVAVNIVMKPAGLTPLNVYRGFTSGLSSPSLKEIVPSARGHIFYVSKLIPFV